MNGGVIPFVLIAVTTGLMLGLANHRLALIGSGAYVAASLVAWSLPFSASEAVLFAGLFVTVLAVGVLVYFPTARSPVWVVALGVNSGLWLGACAAATGSLPALATIALTPIAAALAWWSARCDLIIIAKVAASWMIAIASLTLFVSLLPTPGYQPDHME